MTDNLLASKERNSWIDCLKGVAILLVIWGHTQGISPINTWVQTFHVPIFLGISGYLFCEKEKRISSFTSTLKKVGGHIYGLVSLQLLLMLFMPLFLKDQ